MTYHASVAIFEPAPEVDFCGKRFEKWLNEEGREYFKSDITTGDGIDNFVSVLGQQDQWN